MGKPLIEIGKFSFKTWVQGQGKQSLMNSWVNKVNWIPGKESWTLFLRQEAGTEN